MTRRFRYWRELLIAIAALIAYFPGLDNFFSDIDDGLHLTFAPTWAHNTGHFRPLHGVWNGVLYYLFGMEPLGYHVTGLALHATTAVLVMRLASGLSRSSGAGLVAGLTFAVLYPSSDAVLWFGAHVSLVCAFFVVACMLSFHAYLWTASRTKYALSLLCMAGAMGAKQDSVVLGPCLLALDVAVRGVRGWSRKRLLDYVPFAALAIVYVWVAYRPEVWREGSPGGYSLDAETPLKMLRSVGVLFWPRAIDPARPPSWAMAAGGAFLVAAAAAAVAFRDQRRLIGVGLVIAFAGYLAVAPGPWPIYVKRYAYIPAAGGAFLVAGIAAALWEARLRGLRAMVVAGLVALLGLHVRAIHSIEQWRYAARADMLRTLIAQTRTFVLEPLRSGKVDEVIVIGPPTFRAGGYLHAVTAFADYPATRMSYERLPWNDAFLAKLDSGGALDARTRIVFACTTDGHLLRLAGREQAPLAVWRKLASDAVKAGRGNTIAVVRFHRKG